MGDLVTNTTVKRDAHGHFLEKPPWLAKPWQPGVSPNPGGRPKGADPRYALLRELAAGGEDDPDGIGAESVRIGRSIALALRAIDAADDKEAAELARIKYEAGMRLLAEVQPLPKETKRTDERVGRMVLGFEVCPSCGWRKGQEIAKQCEASVVDASSGLPDSAKADAALDSSQRNDATQA